MKIAYPQYCSSIFCSLLLSSGGSGSLTLPSCDRMNGKSKLKEIKGGFTFLGWGTVIAGTGIVLGGNSSKLKALQENLASFEMMTEWVDAADVPPPGAFITSF